jgi:hypothetical protein
MKYEPHPGIDKAVQPDESESDLQSQLESSAAQPGEKLPKSAPPRQMQTISAREKSIAASALGSDYWVG